MFYCINCAKKYKLPMLWDLTPFTACPGTCEFCEEYKPCYDVHHSHLPKMKEHREKMKKLNELDRMIYKLIIEFSNCLYFYSCGINIENILWNLRTKIMEILVVYHDRLDEKKAFEESLND